MTTTTDFHQAGHDAHRAGVGRAPVLDPAVRNAVAGRPVGDPTTVQIFSDWLSGWDEANHQIDPFANVTIDQLVDLDRDTDDAPVAGRPLNAFVPMQRYPQHTSHRTDDIVGYAVRVSVLGGRTLYAGLPAPTGTGWQRCGYTVAVFDGPDQYSAAYMLARQYRDVSGTWAVVDRLYPCGCRSNI